MRPLCIYHANCADGFGAAWVVRKFYRGEVDFHPGVYQDPPPDVAGRDVILVDFSYKRPVLEGLAHFARTVTVLDHHKTAREDLTGYFSGSLPPFMSMSFEDFALYASLQNALPIRVAFDESRSGAGLTWDHFFPGAARPPLINVIEDRDLWRFALANTREVQANLFSYPYDFEVWDKLMDMDLGLLAADGVAIERKHHKDVAELVGVVTRTMRIGGFDVPVANLPYTYTSDAGHLLAKGSGTEERPEHPFAACYWDTPEGRVFSLRSAKGGEDVSAIAKAYGGGGDRGAAGFRLSFHAAEQADLAP